jgi:long-chain fatty acid transport protein
LSPRRHAREIFLYLILAALRLDDAFAGGYALPPQTARATTLGNAVTAGIDDPSAVYINPAGLTEIPDDQLLSEITYINTQSSVTNSGRRSLNRHDDSFIPTLFANYHIPSTDLTAGIGVYTPYGLAVTYDTDSFTRFASRRTELKTIYITPALAWRPLKYLSIAGGLSFVHASATLSQAVFLGVGNEGKLRLTGTDDAFAYNIGIILKPNNRLKLGLTYRSRVDLDFSGTDAKFVDAPATGGQGITTSVHNTHVPLPPVVSAGINWMINPDWSVEFAYDYTRWSEFQSLKARFSSPLPALGGFFPIHGIEIPQDWKNTSTLRFGTSYNLSRELQLRGGMILDETPIPNRTASPTIPGADWLAVTGGVGYTWKKLSFDAGYMAVFYKTRTVTNDVLEGPGTPFNPAAPGPDKYQTFQNLVLLSVKYHF